MKEITLTINGKQARGRQGDSVLAVCQANGIYVPTLCHLNGLADVGACRLCVVEIQGERRINPSCTYPARDGLVVQTHTDKLEKHRRMILELMFTERNHLCPFCAASGECELQNLAYRYQMDHVRYPYSWPSLPVDSVNDYIVIDHNRCVLCGRCVRACDQVVGNHTLDFGRRGWKTTICADLNQPLGESTCTSCGACAQACPTGAIFTKTSIYKGKTSDCNRVSTVCSQCGIGCEMDVLVRDNNLVRIDSPQLVSTRGELCYRGRFQRLYEKYERVRSPAIRDEEGELVEATWDAALGRVVRGLGDIKRRYGADAIAALASNHNTNESLEAFARLTKKVLGTPRIDTLDGDAYRAAAAGIAAAGLPGGLAAEAGPEDILRADCILLIGPEPLTSHPVAGCYVLRATKENKARLITLDTRANPFPYRVPLQLRPRPGTVGGTVRALLAAIAIKNPDRASALQSDVAAAAIAFNIPVACQAAGVPLQALEHAAEALAEATCGVIVYGQEFASGPDGGSLADLYRLATLIRNPRQSAARVVGLRSQANGRGAWDLGLANSDASVARTMIRDKVKGAYVLAGDDCVEATGLIDACKKVEFLVVHGSYHSPLTAVADVVLPSPTWSEREGTWTTLDGTIKQTRRVLQPPPLLQEDWRVLQDLSRRLRA